MHPLVYLIGRKAKNLEELRAGVAAVPDSSLYFHTHHELHQHEVLSPEPPNDFAFWVKNVYQLPRSRNGSPASTSAPTRVSGRSVGTFWGCWTGFWQRTRLPTATCPGEWNSIS